MEEIRDEKKLANVAREYENLRESIVVYAGSSVISPDNENYNALSKTNKELWVVEDKLRFLEKHKDFGSNFVELARSVYFLNDKRASIKKDINIAHNSLLIEEKSYEEY
jgi:hypothetical protein